MAVMDDPVVRIPKEIRRSAAETQLALPLRRNWMEC